MVAILILTLILFFTFTVNTGLLIHAKISVQAAADAAAYSGAATQGRWLNAISFLNYDMRRQYKKFLFRNAFVGNMGSPDFLSGSFAQGDVDADGRYLFPKFDRSGSPVDYKKTINLRVPAVCMPMFPNPNGPSGKNEDNCMAINQRNTTQDVLQQVGILAGTGGSILDTYLDASRSIMALQNELCKAQGLINQFVLLTWAFRGDSDNQEINRILDRLYTSIPGASQQLQDRSRLNRIIAEVTKGLGLYPKNIFTLMRIQTLVEFLNTTPQTVNPDQLEAWERATDTADTHEHSILAFRSALSNLNHSVFDVSKTEMQELHQAKTLDAQTVEADIDTFIQVMIPSATLNPSAATFCNASIHQIPLRGIPVGVKLNRRPGTNVVYGVKLRAFVKPRGLFFAPWNEPLELSAYAAAKPFGSRTGPSDLNPEAELYEKEVDLSSVVVNGEHICNPGAVALGHKCNVPNMKVDPSDSKLTFFHQDFLKKMAELSTSRPAGTNKVILDDSKLQTAQHHAMAPNPIEVGRYNILPPPPENLDSLKYEFIPYFDKETAQSQQTGPQGTYQAPPAYRFYAPIFKKGSEDVNGIIQKVLDKTLDGAFPNQFGITLNDVKEQTKIAMNNYYLNKLKSTGGDDNETETFAAVQLPLYKLTPPGSKKFWLQTDKEVLSSWGPDHVKIGKTQWGYRPRFGYSVRFVGLQDLLAEGLQDVSEEFDQVGH